MILTKNFWNEWWIIAENILERRGQMQWGYIRDLLLVDKHVDFLKGNYNVLQKTHHF